jgi:D-alanyl-D-alanine carboxypeptidase
MPKRKTAASARTLACFAAIAVGCSVPHRLTVTRRDSSAVEARALRVVAATEPAYCQKLRAQLSARFPALSLGSAVHSTERGVRAARLPTAGGMYVAAVLGPCSPISNIDAQPSPLLRLASISKTVVAMLTLRATAQGLVSLDSDASAWLALPELRGRTLRQLLSHTSGLPTYDAASGFWSTQKKLLTPLDLIAFARTLAYQKAPAPFYYANTNYVLVGLVLESVYQKPLAVIEVDWFRSLGLPSMHPEREGDEVAFCFNVQGARVAAAFRPTMLYAAGDLVATLADTLEWTRRWGKGELVPAEPTHLLQDWLAPHKTAESKISYGLGIFLQQPTHLGALRSHSGNLSGLHAFAGHFEDLGLTTVAIATRDGLDPSSFAREVAIEVRGFLKSEGVTIPE